MRGTEAIDESIDIERALACLTRKQREAVVLAMQGYTQAEIAERIGISSRAVRFRMVNARQTFLITAPRVVIGNE